MQHEPDRIGVGRDHEPPEPIPRLGGEAHRCPGQGEPRPDDLLDLAKALGPPRRPGHPIEHAPPVEDRRGRPQVRLDGDGPEQLGPRLPVAGERLDGGELAQTEVGRRHLGSAHERPRDEAAQPLLGLPGNVGRKTPSRLVAQGEHVGGQHFAPLLHAREVLEESVAVGERRQGRGDGAPHRLVAEYHGARHLLLQARVGVVRHPLAHGGDVVAEPRRERHARAAAAGEGGGRSLDRLAERPVPLGERGLHRALGHGRDHLLRDAHAIGGPARDGRADLPRERGHAGRRGDVPAHRAGLAGGERHLARLGRRHRARDLGPEGHRHRTARWCCAG